MLSVFHESFGNVLHAEMLFGYESEPLVVHWKLRWERERLRE